MYYKKFISFCIAISFIILSTISVFAADELKINSSATAKKDDIVTYSMYLDECTQLMQGIQMYIYYDSDYLEIYPDSSEYEVLGRATENLEKDGYMTFSWTNFSEPADFSEKGGLVSLDFKVLKAGKTDITYFIREMYDVNTQSLKSYRLTCDISVNGEKTSENLTPILNKEKDVINNRQGAFINFEDGMGDENYAVDENHIAVTGNPELGTQNVREVYDVTNPRNGSVFFNSKTGNLIIVSAIVLIIIAIAVIIILRKKQRKENQ